MYSWVSITLKNLNMTWSVYILECADKTLYTGITVDLARRLEEHNTSKLGAKYTKARRPVKIVYSKKCKNRSAAAKTESLIKKMSRQEKIKLIEKLK
jgi:putative endonuclease